MTDAHRTDARTPDARTPDARTPDAHGTDAHGTDAHGTDAHRTDAHRTDAGMIDAGMMDANKADATVTRNFVVWIVLTVLCLIYMWFFPAQQTIPYHVAWAVFILAYASSPWSTRRALIGLVCFWVATAVIMVSRVVQGFVEWEEIVELPLMDGIMLLVVWHIRERQRTLARLQAAANLVRARSASRERLTRLTSHEMRTPLTIARGQIELLLTDEPDPSRREDLEVVLDELDRLGRASDRLIRALDVQGEQDIEHLDLDAILHETARRWSAVADRQWVVDPAGGKVWSSAERLRACLDTLVENALRYTGPGDRIRLHGTIAPSIVTIGVSDSGTGFAHGRLEEIAAGAPESRADPLAQTGLGLGIVRMYAESQGGQLTIGHSPRDGGAEVLLHLPGERSRYAGGYAGGGREATRRRDDVPS